MITNNIPNNNYNLNKFPIIITKKTTHLNTKNLTNNILKLKKTIKNIIN